jgi:hypothetical protein
MLPGYFIASVEDKNLKRQKNAALAGVLSAASPLVSEDGRLPQSSLALGYCTPWPPSLQTPFLRVHALLHRF